MPIQDYAKKYLDINSFNVVGIKRDTQNSYTLKVKPDGGETIDIGYNLEVSPINLGIYILIKVDGYSYHQMSLDNLKDREIVRELFCRLSDLEFKFRSNRATEAKLKAQALFGE